MAESKNQNNSSIGTTDGAVAAVASDTTADAEDVGRGRLAHQYIVGHLGRVQLDKMHYEAQKVIDAWQNEDEILRQAHVKKLKKNDENIPILKGIWQEIINNPDRHRDVMSKALEVIGHYRDTYGNLEDDLTAEEIWEGIPELNKLSLAFYIVSGYCNDIESASCDLAAFRALTSIRKGGFFFGKKKTRKRRKKKSRKKKKKKQTRKKKDRKWTDTTYPYRNITARDAIKDFLRLRKLAQGDINPRSTTGNAVVDYGTEKARRKTKYRNRSFVELWKNKERREKMLKFAKRLHKLSNPGNIHGAIRSAIDLQWGTVNTMRAAAAIHMYKKYDATRVLDFTAGWGARMVAAMALDIDYIGIDSNKSLKPGYEKIIKLLKPYTKSKVKMYWQEAQTVNLSKVGKYDYVFTSPPYEYLEVYENMTNYEKKGDRIRQPSSSQKIKMEDSEKFYDEFLVPTLKNAYKHLPRNKFICLNMPDIMYDKIKKRWKKVTKCEDYSIVKRTGGPTGKDNRRGKELIFCWKKR